MRKRSLALKSVQRRLGRQLDVSSPQCIEKIIGTLTRVRYHLGRGNTAIAMELLQSVEARLSLYDQVVVKNKRPKL